MQGLNGFGPPIVEQTSSSFEIGQSSEQYPYSFWLAMWFPIESTLVEHHLFELSWWSIGQP